MRPHWRYTFIGFLLGLGAPLGSLAWRALTQFDGNLASTLATEWHTAAYYYVYMTLGTTLAFALFGAALGRKNEVLDDLSTIDGLTGLFNHRYLHEELSREIERSDRYASPLTCLMLDIDDFKQVNDRYGHPFGDEVLATTARLLHESVRQVDRVGRYGGEEFLVIMPQTTSEVGLPIANRIVKTIENHAFITAEGTTQVTVSIGLATYPAPESGVKTKNSLLSAADQALYQAKRSGKNRTVLWQR